MLYPKADYLAQDSNHCMVKVNAYKNMIFKSSY